jgi:hypothetical protein
VTSLGCEELETGTKAGEEFGAGTVDRNVVAGSRYLVDG